MKILGVWYSTSQIHRKIMASSLESIQKAQSYSKAGEIDVDVRTCVWSPLGDINPFPETIAWFKLGVHLGIAMQILQVALDWDADRRFRDADSDCGGCVLALLEHDVLYPHDYFNKTAQAFRDNPLSIAVSHRDYIGMNQTGYLALNQRDEPLHQSAFRLVNGIDNFMRVVKGCIVNGAVCLEPDNKEGFARLENAGGRPSVHMNNSRHFTSHYNVFAKDSCGLTDHPYWGNFRKYYPEGEHQVA